ncbi:SDR family oxidoreductase [Dokdonia sp. Hel_I_53]|uniref:SDR family oxidoreductase n=1 Tax=Dokdonia sp. Hel_I_53 TaxID=1566287 RepID=UPI00119910AB|nr:SDR family oxidoreductase [Dokdonia sp. Hel_I_53]TVZ51694.1 NAD(P)-dependent dehydrogenase (short-subunit alcohol dehydrogenase family) [Dokdonia sp. Hel_I_53]
MQSYKNKYAVILGGSSGLGLATAQKLAQEGMHLIIVHRSRRSVMATFEENVTAMQQNGANVLTFNTDALHPQKREQVITELLEKIGKHQVKAIIHSVARGNLKPMYSQEGAVLSNEDFKLTLDAMAVNYYDWVSAFAKAELCTPNARAIAFTSEGSSRAWSQYGAVAAAKAALESISRGIALEFAPVGITSNCILAGVTDTESLRLIPGSELMKEKSLERNPYGRLTLPEDVGNAVYLLMRDEAAWINGAVIPVDGGEHIR